MTKPSEPKAAGVVLDGSLQNWEAAYFTALAKRMGWPVHSVDGRNPTLAALDSVNSNGAWIVSRNWPLWKKALQKSSDRKWFLSLFGDGPAPGFSLREILGLGKSNPSLCMLAHTPLNYRFFSEIERRGQDDIRWLELPYIDSTSALTLASASEPFKVAVLAELEPESNLNALAGIAHYMRRKSAACEFHIIGRGWLSDHIDKISTELGVKEHIRLVSPEQPLKVHALLQLCLKPHHYIPIFNAASAEIPVVAFGSVGIDRWVDDGRSGFSLPALDTKGVAELLIRLMEIPSLGRSLGENLKKRCIDLGWGKESEKVFARVFPQVGPRERAA